MGWLLLAAPASPAAGQVPESLVVGRDAWRFRAGDSLAWATPGATEAGWRPVPAFGPWRRYLPRHRGWVWYRAAIPARALREDVALAVQVGRVGGAYELYLNGVRLGGSGKLPPRFRESVSPNLLPIPPGALERGEAAGHVLTLRTYDDRGWGGLYSGVRIGSTRELLAAQPPRDLAVTALVAIFATLGLYHLLFFTLRRAATENLWFALLCLSIGLHGLGFAPALHQRLLPTLERMRSSTLAEVLAALSMALLVRALFSFRFRIWERAVVAIFAAAIPAVLLLPPGPLEAAHYLVDAAVLLGLLFLVGRIVRMARSRTPHAKTLLGGVAFFGLTVILDLLAEYEVLPVIAVIPGAPGAFWLGFLGLVLVFGKSSADNWAASEARANTDALTGLASRRLFHETLRRQLHRSEGAGPAVVLIDLDHFKSVNDRYGHAMGDEVLVRAGGLLQRRAHLVDLAARLGGEELAVVLVGRRPGEARRFAEDFRRALERERFVAGGDEFQVTASAGVAEAAPGMEPDQVIRMADEALYRAKRAGRNRSEVSAAVTAAAGEGPA